jgi:hypothetical protein
MAGMAPIIPPKDSPHWLYEILRRIGMQTSQQAQAITAIGQGFSPNGSGQPLLNTAGFFLLAGRPGGQLGYGDTNAAGKLTLSSTASATKGFIYLGSALTSAYDETQDFLGIGIASSLLARLHLSGTALEEYDIASFTVSCVTNSTATVTAAGVPNFLPSGGPAVVQGMLVTGSGIPANTFIKSIESGSSLTLSAAATSSLNPVTLTFRTYITVGVSGETETGKDVDWKSAGAIRFTLGQNNYPFRMVGDKVAWATGIAVDGRLSLETGIEISGVNTGGNLQIGGTQHGELTHFNLKTRTAWLGRSAVAGTNINVGIGADDPATFGDVASGFGPSCDLYIARSSNTTALAIRAAGSSTNAALIVLGSTATSGSSPTKSLALTSFAFKVTEDSRVWVGDSAGAGSYFTASSTSLGLNGGTSTLNMLRPTEGIASWSDSAVSLAIYLGALTGTSAKRVWFSNSSNGVLDRVAFSSLYHLISNSQAGNAEFYAPSASPEVLQIANGSSNGADASVVLKIRSARTAQSGNMLQVTSAVASTVDLTVNARSVIDAGRIKSAVLFTDDNATIASAKLMGFNVSQITAGQTRTLAISDISGQVMVDVNHVFSDDEVVAYEDELIFYP